MRRMMVVFAMFSIGCLIHTPVVAKTPQTQKSTTYEEAEIMVGKEMPEKFRDGFCHGCDSGKTRAGNKSYVFKKNKKRFDTEKMYFLGWNLGYNRCHLAEKRDRALAPAKGFREEEEETEESIYDHTIAPREERGHSPDEHGDDRNDNPQIIVHFGENQTEDGDGPRISVGKGPKRGGNDNGLRSRVGEGPENGGDGNGRGGIGRTKIDQGPLGGFGGVDDVGGLLNFP